MFDSFDEETFNGYHRRMTNLVGAVDAKPRTTTFFNLAVAMMTSSMVANKTT